MGQQQDTMHPTNESIGWYVPAMESEECGMQCILGGVGYIITSKRSCGVVAAIHGIPWISVPATGRHNHGELRSSME